MKVLDMRICVTSTGEDLSAEVDPRFGRCRYFVIIDTDTMNVEAISNDSAAAYGGAGVNAAQTLARADVKVLLTGNVGPNAFQTLKAAGIEIITGVSGTVEEAVERYKKGEFDRTDAPTVGGHFGRR